MVSSVDEDACSLCFAARSRANLLEASSLRWSSVCLLFAASSCVFSFSVRSLEDRHAPLHVLAGLRKLGVRLLERRALVNQFLRLGLERVDAAPALVDGAAELGPFLGERDVLRR